MMPLVIGNVVSLLSGVFFSAALTFIFGEDDFDWSRLQTSIRVARDGDVKGITEEQLRQQEAAEHLTPEATRGLRRTGKLAMLATAIFFSTMMILWPRPMVGTSYIFSKNIFRGWVVSVTMLISLFFSFGCRPLISGVHLYLGFGCRTDHHFPTTVGGSSLHCFVYAGGVPNWKD